MLVFYSVSTIKWVKWYPLHQLKQDSNIFSDIFDLKGQCHQIRMTLKWGSFKGLS